MAHGKKTGGRQLGTTNKATSTLQVQVEEEAGAPLPVLLTRIGIKAMERKDYHLAVTALTKAMAYTYPRMQSVTQEGQNTALIPPIVIIDDIPNLTHWPGPLVTINTSSSDLKKDDHHRS